MVHITNIMAAKAIQEQIRNDHDSYKYIVKLDRFPLFKALIPSQRLREAQEGYTNYYNAITRIRNISCDIINSNTYHPTPNKDRLPLYEEDTAKYRYINAKPSYKDIRPSHILLILFQKHKITKLIYKETLKRLKIGKKPKGKVLALISSYYSTLKANHSKNSLTALNRQKLASKRLRVNINGYSILIKKRTARRISHLLSQEALLAKLDRRGILDQMRQEMLKGGLNSFQTVSNLDEKSRNVTTYRIHRVHAIHAQIAQEFQIKLRNSNKLFIVQSLE